MAQRRLSLVLDLDTGRYSGRLTQAGAQMRSFGGTVDRTHRTVRQFSDGFDRMGSRMSTPLQKLRDYVLILGNLRFALINVRDLAVGWVGALLNQAAKVERLTVLMKGLSTQTSELGKSSEAKQNLSELFDMARKTGFAVDDLTDAFVKFKSAKLNPRDGSLQALADAVAAFGGTSDTMHRASIAIQQMAGKGVISMEELRQQLGEAVPSAMAVMARAMGKTVAELSKEVATGTVAAGPALKLMFEEMQRTYAGAGRRMSQTLTGQLSELRTNITALSTDFTQLGSKTGLFSGTVQSVRELNTAFKSGEGRAAVAQIGNAVASVGQALVGIVKIAIDWRDQMGAAIKTIAVGIAALTAKRFASWIAVGAVEAVASMRAMSVSFAASKAEYLAFRQVLAGNVTPQNFALIQNNAAAIELQQIKARIAAEQTLIGVTRNAQAGYRQTISNLQGEISSYRQLIPQIQVQVRQRQAQLRSAQTLHAANVALGRDSTASANMVAQAERNLTRETTNLTRTKLMMRQATQGLTAAEVQLLAALNAETLATERLTLAEGMNTVGKRAMAMAATAAAGATRMLGAAMSIALGPIGMAVTALYMVAQAAGVFESSADRAATAAQRMAQGFQEAGDAAVVAARKASISADIQSIEKGGMFKIEHGDSIWNTGVNFNTNRDAELKKKRAELAALNDDEVKGARASYANRSRQWQDHVTQGHEAYVDKQTLIYNRELTLAEKNIKDKKALFARQKQLREVYDARLAQDLERRTVDLERRVAERKSKGLNAGPLENALSKLRQRSLAAQQSAAGLGDTAAGAGKGLDKFARSAAMADAKAAGIAATMAGGGKAIAEFNSKLNSGIFKGMNEAQIASLRRAAVATDALAASKKSAGADDGFETRMVSMAGRLAQMKDALTDGNGELARFNAQMAASPDKLGLSAQQIQRLQDLAQAIDETAHQQDVKKAMDGLTDSLTRATTEGDELWRSFNAGTLEADERLASIKARFSDKLIGLTGQELAAARTQIDGIVAAMERADAVKTVDGWRSAAEEIQIGLLNENEQREANFQRELQRQQILLDAIRNNAAMSTSEKQRAEEQFNNWRRASDARLQRENEGAIAKQARDWANLGQNVQQTMASALSSIVDSVGDTNADIGKMTADILTALTKVIIQAMIAYAILSAIGMANNSAGEHVSLGQFLKGQMAGGMTLGGKTDSSSMIGYGAGGSAVNMGASRNVEWGGGELVGGAIKVPTHHTGGVIGRASMSATVPADVFNKAKAFHTGGRIGGRALRPGEVPMIGMEDEVVLTKEQQRLLGSSGGMGAKPNVQVNVINNSGTELEAEHGEPEFNGKDMIVQVVVEAAQRQGKLRDVFSQMAKGG